MIQPNFDYLLQEYGAMKDITEEGVAGQTRYRMKGEKGWMSRERVYGVLVATYRAIEESRRIGEAKKLRALEDAFGPDELVDPIALGVPLG
ncbi:MAG: hypothetical protein V1837_00235 [Candidatus Woesearchaeota archaeon]